MKTKNKKTIVICSSASFYPKVLEVQQELKKLGFKVDVPMTANKMKKANDFRVESYKTWFNNPDDYKRKAFLTRNHFGKIVKGDVILVLNYKKNGKDGYIGGAVLNEMSLSFYLKKPIFILNPIDESSSYKEEIYGMLPVVINGDFSKIK